MSKIIFYGLFFLVSSLTCCLEPIYSMTQSESENEDSNNQVARIMTNDDFLPIPEAKQAPLQTKLNSVKPKNQEASSIKNPLDNPVTEKPPSIKSELNMYRDSSGNWILTSTQVPTSSRSATLFSTLTVSTGKPELDQLIYSAGQKYGVDPRLILEVMRQESGFHQYAISPAGAKGLMQFIPSTAQRMGIIDIFDMKQNVEGGAKYIRQLLDMFDGNVELALAGYNSGENRVIRNGYRIPQIRETQNYVRNIINKYGSTKHTLTSKFVSKKINESVPMRIETRNGTVFLTNN